jgi:glycosyltransferase involved in cell wall biosynthesis
MREDFSDQRLENTEASERNRSVRDEKLAPPQIAVIVPCFNEELTIVKVIQEFKATLPEATVYVYDNNSNDRTAAVAREAGAVVGFEPLAGKGNVVRRMFSDIDADVYVMVDGDATYDAASAPRMVSALIDEQLDMVTGVRVTDEQDAYRLGHRFGNRLLTGAVATIFGNRFSDMLSGYRVMSRRFVKSFPALSRGFEIETELTVHALEMRSKIGEQDTPYFSRPEGSASKLNTIRDGIRIARTIATLVKEERPLQFFSLLAVALVLVALVLAWPIMIEYLDTGLVPRFPTAILSSALMILAFLSLACGLILDTVTHGRQELKRMHYLNIPLFRLKPRRPSAD